MARAARGSKAAVASRIAPASSVRPRRSSNRAGALLGDRSEDRLGCFAVKAGDQGRELGDDQVLPPDLGLCRSGRTQGARGPRRDRPPEVLRRPIRVDPDGQGKQSRHRHRRHDHLRC